MSLHAIKREESAARVVQAKAVMRVIGPLLDAWEGLANDTKGALRDECPALCESLDKLSSVIGTGLYTHDR